MFCCDSSFSNTVSGGSSIRRCCGTSPLGSPHYGTLHLEKKPQWQEKKQLYKANVTKLIIVADLNEEYSSGRNKFIDRIINRIIILYNVLFIIFSFVFQDLSLQTVSISLCLYFLVLLILLKTLTDSVIFLVQRQTPHPVEQLMTDHSKLLCRSDCTEPFILSESMFLSPSFSS